MSVELYLTICSILVGVKYRASREEDKAAEAKPYDKIRHEYLMGESAHTLMALSAFQQWFKEGEKA